MSEIGAEFLHLDLQIALIDADLNNKCNVTAYKKAVEKGCVWSRAIAVVNFTTTEMLSC